MFHIVLFEPEIPPNTGNIIRLTVNAGAILHLIHPLGFELNNKQLKRAGMDYADFSSVNQHLSYSDFAKTYNSGKIYAASTKGSRIYTDIDFVPGDAIIFGPETRGLPDHILDNVGRNSVLRIPMHKNSRSLNLSNAAAIILYEALRQNGFMDTK